MNISLACNRSFWRKLALTLFFLFLQACSTEQAPLKSVHNEFVCDQDNGGLILPSGFCAKVVADNLGIVRHITVRKAGQIYASLRNRSLNIGGLLVLEDSDQDHIIDNVTRIGEAPGMGIGLYKNYLYFASDTEVIRYLLRDDEIMPSTVPELVISDLPKQRQHSGKPFAIDEAGNMYINIGSESNACQTNDRKAGELAQDPCSELESLAGIWRFDANKTGQSFTEHAERFASGIRNAYAIDWHTEADKLYAVQHGRDHLHELWPEYFSLEDEQLLPAEELIEVGENSTHAWPYCYYDQFKKTYIQAPEYGGDGEQIGRCAAYPAPVTVFPAHYGPNDLVIYDGDMFPKHYQGGAFIAFHGSYLLEASKQVGYQVVFVKPGEKGLSSNWDVFADGFVGTESIKLPQDADYRPTGLAVGEDGSLYISDSVQGRIWRVIYQQAEE